MGIFNLFNKKNREDPGGGFMQILDGFTSMFAPFGDDKLQSDIFLSAVTTNATHRSKLRLVHRRAKLEQILPHQRILQLRPNPIMNATVFLESLSIDYDTYNNAFIYIERDTTGRVIALWRLNPSTLLVGMDKYDELLCRFTLQGYEYTVPFDQICHIGKTVTQDEIFGDENNAINKILGIINTNYQGIEAAVKTSGVLRYVVKVLDKVSDKDLRKHEKWFTKNILNPLNSGGVKYIDSAMELQELRAAAQKYSDFNEQKLFATQVYNHLGTNEKIISRTNSDDDMIAFYEGTIEPFALKLSQELTFKIFTSGQLDFQNEIVAESNRLAFMSISRRIEVARIGRELGIMTKGDMADLLYLPIREEIRNELIPLSQNYSKKEKEEKEDDSQEK